MRLRRHLHVRRSGRVQDAQPEQALLHGSDKGRATLFSVRLCGNIETAGRAPVARVEHSIEYGHADSLSVICLRLADLDSYPCNSASIWLETTTGDCPRRWAQISSFPFEPIRTTQPLPLSVLKIPFRVFCAVSGGFHSSEKSRFSTFPGQNQRNGS